MQPAPILICPGTAPDVPPAMELERDTDGVQV